VNDEADDAALRIFVRAAPLIELAGQPLDLLELLAGRQSGR
jgi:hypothetical protein